MKPYKAKTLSGAEAMVRSHRKQLVECHRILDKWAHERKLLAMLAADTPQFFNPLEAMQAKKVRDSILSFTRNSTL